MGDGRGPLDRVKDAVAAALTRRSGREDTGDDRTDDADREGVDGLAEQGEHPFRTAGVIARPDLSRSADEPDGDAG